MTELPDIAGPAPDLIDPIIGYRQWRLAGRGLSSVFNDTRWDRARISACCDSHEHHPEVVPDHHCSCGIYAYYDPCPRTASALTRDLVGGAVVMWGRVELHGTGLRAEHAQIVGARAAAVAGVQAPQRARGGRPPGRYRRAAPAAARDGPRAGSAGGSVAAPAPHQGAGRHLVALVGGLLMS